MITNNTINIMIVDDSRVMRNILMKILEQDSNFSVTATATNGIEAIQELEKNLSNIQIILLDIMMPIMDGIQVIPHLLKLNPRIKIIMVSTLTSSGAKYTLEALSLGASDYIEKLTDKIEHEQFSKDLLAKIHALANVNNKVNDTSLAENNLIKLREKPFTFKPDIIAIASSTGGPRALMEVLGGWSESFLENNIILITQHIKNDFIDLLVDNINAISKVHCKKAVEEEELKKGIIYLAPSDKHLEVIKNDNILKIHLSDSPPENFCRPSADPMFRSLAALKEKSLAIVLTGIGSDGLLGAKKMIESNNVVIAQDKETSVVWGMPGAVASAGFCSAILPLHKIASYVEKNM